jgi:hypothetical protein
MITLLVSYGSLMYVDPYGNATATTMLFTRIEKYKAHYQSIGLSEDFIEQFIR